MADALARRHRRPVARTPTRSRSRSAPTAACSPSAATAVVRLWDVGTGKLVHDARRTGARARRRSSSAPTAAILAVSGFEPGASLWDVATGTQIGPSLDRRAPAAMIDLSSDGRRLLMTAANGEGAIWDIDPDSWARRACALANRTLTREEWERFLPGRPYEPACASEPAGPIDHVKRVSAAGGARPPGRRPRRTSSVGGIGLPGEPEAGRAEALAVPPRREPDDEQPGVAARLQHAVLARRGQQRLGGDAEDALDGERAVRQQPARIAPAVFRYGGGAREPQRCTVRAREPRAELDGRPVVLGAAERDEHGPWRCRVPGNEQRHVAGRLREQGGELLVGRPAARRSSGASASSELDVELGREPSEVRAGRRRREGRRTRRRRRAPRVPTGVLEPGRREGQLRGVRHEPGEDQHATRIAARAARPPRAAVDAPRP